MRRRSNCIVYAWMLEWRLKRWVKAHPERAHWRVYRAKRKSDWGSFRHRLVIIHNTANGASHIVSWKPTSPTKRKWPPPLFIGGIHWGDGFPGNGE